MVAKKKKIPAAVITSGTIIGEINNPINNPLQGISERESPSAASVPNITESKVDQSPIKKELPMALRQISLDQKSSYQRVEYASDFRASIFSLKVK